MTRIIRNQTELEKALVDRLKNLDDDINDYKLGKRHRIKNIAANLRVLVIETPTNIPLLLHVAKLNKIELKIVRDVPPIKDLKSELLLEEMLEELGFVSNVPTPVRLSNNDLIKDFADLEGSHEDHQLPERFDRLEKSGLYIGNSIPAHEYALLGLASEILGVSKLLRNTLNNKFKHVPSI